MTPETLEACRKLARMALDKARRSLEDTGSVAPVFLVEYDNSIEVFELHGAAGDALNSGPDKDKLFHILRRFAHEVDATAVVICTEAWLGEQTEAGARISPEEFQKLSMRIGFNGALDLGLITRREVIMTSVQTREGALTVSLPFTRDEENCVVSYGAEREEMLRLDQFAGRQKMFDQEEV